MDNKVYLTSGEGNTKLWVTDDPASGKWTIAADFGIAFGDPDLFLDDDGRLYMYDGVDDKTPLRVTELNRKTFQKIRQAEIPQGRSEATRGWEISGDKSDQPEIPAWIEGSWMNKHDGTYYLQFAAPGTQFKTYGDGVLTSKDPMGPFTYAPYSPFSFKPTGFISGAGHSSTFAALDKRYWHIASMSISRRHPFERRLGLFPAEFTHHGQLVTDTYLGDYPHYISGNRSLVGWMLLSRRKPVTASSAMEGHSPELATDEDVRTWWSAKSGDPGEWLQMDLESEKTIEAFQINFADEGSSQLGLTNDVYRYVLEVSSDSHTWHIAVNHEKDGRDGPDDYEVLPLPTRGRYIRVRNIHSPNGAKFSLSDLRVFGRGSLAPPEKVSGIEVRRDPNDGRHATVTWKLSQRAEFYIVRLGANSKKLTLNYQVYDGATTLMIPSLNSGVSYSVTVDAVNEGGIKPGPPPVTIR